MRSHDLVFWQNNLSLHQAPLMKALTSSFGKRVLVVVPEGLSEARNAMGWSQPDFGNATILVAETGESRFLAVNQNRDAEAHYFSGLGAYPSVDFSLRELVAGPHNHVGIISESWDPRGAKGKLRAIRMTGRVKKQTRAVDSFYVAGDLAQRQFRRAGVPTVKLRDFGYSVDIHPTIPLPNAASEFHIVFVGILDERKDPTTLVQALNRMPDLKWRADFYGDGPLGEKLRSLINVRGLTDRVRFHGNASNAEVRRVIATSDVLVLPSRYDGWGAVVNEALMNGTPALVSRSCGAAVLIADDSCGAVFSGGNVSELERQLRSRIASGKQSSASREKLAEWSQEAISPRSMAGYLLEELGNNKLGMAPWKR